MSLVDKPVTFGVNRAAFPIIGKRSKNKRWGREGISTFYVAIDCKGCKSELLKCEYFVCKPF
jgi:hypothetical protein